MHCWDDEDEEKEGGIGSCATLVIVLNGRWAGELRKSWASEFWGPNGHRLKKKEREKERERGRRGGMGSVGHRIWVVGLNSASFFFPQLI